MPGKKEAAKERILGVVETCNAIISGELTDPFAVNVDDLIEIVRECFPELDEPEDLCLDAEAVNKIATIIKLQSDWVKHRASSLYTDPFLIEDKIRSISIERLAEIFLKTWHPIVELEQISIPTLREALKYWVNLTPIDERWRNIGFIERIMGTVRREEVVKENILADEAFTGRLEDLWRELKERSRGQDKIRYWDFIGSEEYKETLERAYLTSFLITYGYADLEIHPLEEEIFIRPREKPPDKPPSEQLISIPIPISLEEWIKWRRSREA